MTNLAFLFWVTVLLLHIMERQNKDKLWSVMGGGEAEISPSANLLILISSKDNLHITETEKETGGKNLLTGLQQVCPFGPRQTLRKASWLGEWGCPAAGRHHVCQGKRSLFSSTPVFFNQSF